MIPTHHRYVFAGFGVMAIAVAANLTLLQPASLAGRSMLAAADPQVLNDIQIALPGAGRRPRAEVLPATVLAQVSVASLPNEQGIRRYARLRPDAALADRPGDQLPEAPDVESDPATISAVQRELSQRGYGPLLADGSAGLVTRAAIMAFEFDNQMPLKGEATATLLARIVLGVSGSGAADSGARRVRSTQAELVMRTVQQSLATLGYQVGKIDGRNGDEIGRAIREFELDEGLKQSGRVSAEVFTRLARVVASAKPKPKP